MIRVREALTSRSLMHLAQSALDDSSQKLVQLRTEAELKINRYTLRKLEQWSTVLVVGCSLGITLFLMG
jgi:hypothetical protein